MDPTYSLAPPLEITAKPRPWLFLKSVFVLYRDGFHTWFVITAPASLLASVVIWLADQRIRAIFRSFPPRESFHHPADVAATFVLRFGSYFLSWLLGCFALAAIATEVNGLNDDDNGNAVWRHDSHQRARDNFGPFFLLALLTFCAFLAGMAVVGFADLAIVPERVDCPTTDG